MAEISTKLSEQKVNRFVSNDLTVRVAAVDATVVVQEMQRLHNSRPLASIGVGRAMVASLLMASQLKEGQQVGLYFRGNGPLGSLYAEATYEGQVRGYCPNPQYQAPEILDNLKLGKAMGFGTLNVARHQPFQRQPFNGTVNMVSGEVGDDVAHYLAQSHQIRSLVSLGVYIDPNGQVSAAGGLLIEVMPGVEDAIVDLLQKNHDANKINISKMLVDGASPADLIVPYMSGIPFTQIPHDHKIQYYCPCSAERVKGALTVMGVQGLEEMINDQEPAEITCQICGRRYEISVEELTQVKEQLRKGFMH